MKILERLPSDDWLLAIETTSVMKSLMASGSDVRFVGGCVRDALMRKSVTDIDIDHFTATWKRLWRRIWRASG